MPAPASFSEVLTNLATWDQTDFPLNVALDPAQARYLSYHIQLTWGAGPGTLSCVLQARLHSIMGWTDLETILNGISADQNLIMPVRIEAVGVAAYSPEVHAPFYQLAFTVAGGDVSGTNLKIAQYRNHPG